MIADPRHHPHVIDWRYLNDALSMACDIRGISQREAARQIGVSPSMVSRFKSGNGVSADHVAALVAWLFPSVVPDWITFAPEGGQP